jgi:cellobiose epimerase
MDNNYRGAITHMLIGYKNELKQELIDILSYWQMQVTDHEQGGFYGAVDNQNRADSNAPKGIVLNSRILWAFSAAANSCAQNKFIEAAERSFNYITKNFIDKNNGGVYWAVDAKGNLLDGRKQIYGLAFCIYALAEYYKLSKNEEALRLAKQLVNDIEKYSFDKNGNGYTEAFTENWQPINDLRLSEKDSNEKKTANTHLHIIEAYANLYTANADEIVLKAIENLLQLFDKYIIEENGHLRLFMDEGWTPKSQLQSYGHEIEASWLLYKCAQITKDEKLINKYKSISLNLAKAAEEGLDDDGGLWYEYEPKNDFLTKEKHSWPQAEAMIGFFNAAQLSGNEEYIHKSIRTWKFVKKHIKDSEQGEWFWGVNADYSIMQKDKAGFWKCPYHNSRACLEIIHRISALGIN